MNNNFRILNEMLGWGDLPINGLLFVGLEEASSWDGSANDKRKIEVLERYLNQGLYGEPIGEGVLKKNRDEFTGKRFSDVFLIMSKVILKSGFDHDYVVSTEPHDYWCNRLFQKGSRVFQANLYPLGKARLFIQHSEDAKKMFGFNDNEYSMFIHDNDERFRRIRQFKELFDPAATICFGKAGWKDFRNVFNLTLDDEISRKDSPFEVYESKRIILTPFFWNKDMGHDNISKLADIIKSRFL